MQIHAPQVEVNVPCNSVPIRESESDFFAFAIVSAIAFDPNNLRASLSQSNRQHGIYKPGRS